MNTIHAVVDFDSTLTVENVAVELLERYTPESLRSEIRRAYESHEITFRSYQERAFDLIEQPVGSISKYAASTANVRSLVSETFQAIWDGGGTVGIASAGLDLYIEPILKKAGLEKAELHSGKVVSACIDTAPFHYEYPSANFSCQGDWVTCKCQVIKNMKTKDPMSEVIFVGDGLLGDSCAAENEADTVFAKDRLLGYCKAKNITVTTFDEDFRPIYDYVTKNIRGKGSVKSDTKVFPA